MKASSIRQFLVLSFCLAFPAGNLRSERIPGILMDPALYQQRIEAGLADVPPDPPRSAAEMKMSSQLASLSNPDLRPPGVTPEAVKLEMVRLGQLQPWQDVPQDTPYGPVLSDLLYVYVTVEAAASLGPVRTFCFGVPDESPEWLMLAGWIEQDRLADVALLPDVRFVRAVDPPRFRTGSVTSAGDALHHGPQARAAPLGITGEGIQVGVISDGVSQLAAAQASGDLPPMVNVLLPGRGDEGTAMLEIIHDLAPGAPLAFAPSGSNQIAFGNAVAALAFAGCKVICDDVGWYDDPFFEHSQLGWLISQLRTTHDYVHVSAAGNDAQLHHQQLFTDAYPSPGGDNWHDPVLFVNIPPNGVLDVFMQWKEPLATPPASDFDLYLYDYNTMAPIASGVNRGVVGDTIYYTNRGSSIITAAIYVHHVSGPASQEIEIFMEPQNNALQYTNGTSPVDAIFGHPGHGSVMAVVATDVATPTVIEWDSSQGPFSVIGMLQPVKPDAAAADGVAVTGAGGFGTPFHGTSAAAPHVAGVLALAWSRSPGISGAALKSSLMLACNDLGSPGYDTVFGWGHPLADQWANLLNMPPQLSVPPGMLECAQLRPREISGVLVTDPDSGPSPVVVTLAVSFGNLMLDLAVPGGLTPPEVVPGGPGQLTATAPLSRIHATLSAPQGLVYLGNPVPPGPPWIPVNDSLVITVNDQGNTGVGGPLGDNLQIPLRVHAYAYEAWRHECFTAGQLLDPAVSGDHSSPDGDVHSNIWEFFMGTDPLSRDLEQAVTCGVSGGNLVIRFRVSMELQPQDYAIKVSQDLSIWTAVPLQQITNPWPAHPAGNAWWMEVKRPVSANIRDFFRIEFDPRP